VDLSSPSACLPKSDLYTDVITKVRMPTTRVSRLLLRSRQHSSSSSRMPTRWPRSFKLFFSCGVSRWRPKRTKKKKDVLLFDLAALLAVLHDLRKQIRKRVEARLAPTKKKTSSKSSEDNMIAHSGLPRPCPCSVACPGCPSHVIVTTWSSAQTTMPWVVRLNEREQQTKLGPTIRQIWLTTWSAYRCSLS